MHKPMKYNGYSVTAPEKQCTCYAAGCLNDRDPRLDLAHHRKQPANTSSPARDFVIACGVVGTWIAVMNALVILSEWVRAGR